MGRQRPRVSPWQCAHMDSSRPMQSQTWPYGGRLNTEKMMPSYGQHVCPASYQDGNGCCLCSFCTGATKLSPFLHIPRPPKLLLLHQRPSECLQVNKSMYGLFKRVFGSPASFHFTGKGRQISLIFTARCLGISTFWHRFLGLGNLVWGWEPFHTRESHY